MTTFPALSAADQIAAMEARAETERTIYGQTPVPEMLDQGAASGEEVERLKEALAMASAALCGTVKNMSGDDVFRFGPGYRSVRWLRDHIAALSTPPQGPAVGEPEAMK